MDEQKNASRVVVVTGGAKGIGYGVAECFARKNDRLVLADLAPELARGLRGAVQWAG